MKTGITLDVTHPSLVSEWHPDNPPIETTSKGSVKKFKWLCTRGHTWEAPPCNRVKGSGCPYCSGYKPIMGETDLLTVYPIIALQWSERNPLPPTEYTGASGKKVWWKCEYLHEWQSTIANRTRGGNGCPHCAVGSVPRIEIGLLCSFSRYGEVRHHYRVDNLTVDLFLPAQNIVVEYDGAYWHRNREKQDIAKTNIILEADYSIIRFREFGLPHLDMNDQKLAQATVAWASDQDRLNSAVDLVLASIDFFHM